MKDHRDRRALPLCAKTGKKSHPDYHSAARHMKFQAKAGRESVDVFSIYLCDHCRHWHVGHKPQTRITEGDK